MKYAHYIIVLIIFIIGLTPAWLMGYIYFFNLLGYHAGGVGWKVAEIAIQKHDATECERIIDVPWNLMSPPAYQQRSMCYSDVAEGAQDFETCQGIPHSDLRETCIKHVNTEI